MLAKQSKVQNGDGDKILSSFVGEIILATKEVNNDFVYSKALANRFSCLQS
jgi:hypothetical protein